MLETVFLLLFAHGIADFALQSDMMARGKNRHVFDKSKAPPGQKPCNCWFWWMLAHSLANGGLYYLFTSNILIGLIESIVHFIVDCVKCENITNPHQDQAIHIACIILYSILNFNMEGER